ncbi:MAG: bacteriocin [Lachnospiraceae bacterium]|nr:bacteriocin [Lachnospiraceae bacterium]
MKSSKNEQSQTENMNLKSDLDNDMTLTENELSSIYGGVYIPENPNASDIKNEDGKIPRIIK